MKDGKDENEEVSWMIKRLTLNDISTIMDEIDDEMKKNAVDSGVTDENEDETDKLVSSFDPVCIFPSFLSFA